MPSTAAIPNFDTMARSPVVTPRPAKPDSADESNSDDVPTLRVPVRPATSAAPLQSPATTPPPAADLKFSSSSWSGDDEFLVPGTRRAPRVGDTISGFKLVGELGRGAFARVFLAEQQTLANRLVALKVTLRRTSEAERLARLQHTNIVPVYSVHDEGSAQVICMPYLGRVTIADLIRAYRADHPSRQTARKSTSARAGRTTTTDSGSRSKSSSTSDSQSGSSRTPTWAWAAEEPPPIVGDPVAVLQALAQLTEGLSHAHERGILHLDLKPANVLLADTGEPMLLDFNLSYDALNPARELVGGTMPYMAIEQLLDMRARGNGVLDQRTDLYALGVMAFEMLTGTVLFPTSSKAMRDLDTVIAARRQDPPSIRKLNPAVTPAVEAIVRKLLSPEPADRYQTAEELRQDLQRQLSDQPLKYAREASLRERFGKWRRRNPGLPLRMLVACVIGLALGMGGVAYRRAEAAARVGAIEHARETHQALDTIRLDLILPDDSTARARGVKKATELLASYGLPGEADWQKRTDVQQLSEAERVELAGDLGELMILLAQAKWQEASARSESERRELVAEAWKLNTTARTCFAEIPTVLDQQTATIAPAVGEEFVVAAGVAKEPASTREFFLDAVMSFTHGRYVSAIPSLDRVIAAQPNHAAAQFCLAFCRQQLGQYARAIERYDATRVLLPTDPRSAFQRGVIYRLTKKPKLAEEEFTKAIALNPDYADAYRYRALARYHLGTVKAKLKGHEKESADLFAEAEADLNAAQERGTPVLYIHLIRARVRDTRGDRSGADRDRAAAKDAVAKTETDYVIRGWSRMEIDPKSALADFQKATELNPRSLIAFQNQAHILAEKLKDNAAALLVTTKLAQMYPEYAPAIAGQAVVLARLGRREEAHKEIERARQLSEDDPEIIYQAASVFSLTSAKHNEDQAKALALLRQSLSHGYADLRSMATDPDLDPIRETKEFHEIRRAAATIFR